MSFAAHFRSHVCPRLINLARAEAACIAEGVETWEGAQDAIVRYARKFGMFDLQPMHLVELHDWIRHELLEAVDAAERLKYAEGKEG